jgi:hypothetical protein
MFEVTVKTRNTKNSWANSFYSDPNYLLSSMGGYIDGKDENTDYFPFIEGGTCSPL